MASTTPLRRQARRPRRRAAAPDPWAEGRARLVELAGHAPSPMGMRPWRMRERQRGLDLLVDLSRVTRRGSQSRRQALIACGAVLFNVRLGVAQLGYQPTVTCVLQGDLLARVEPGPPNPAGAEERDLLWAVERRHAYRAEFARTFVPDAVRDRLAAAAAHEGGVLVAVPPGPRRSALDAATREAARRTPHDPARLRGMRAPWPAGQPASIEVLCTDGDGDADWLAAGQALQRMLLTATLDGLQVRFFSLALEDSELREAVRREVTAGQAPQLVLELGHAGRPEEG